MVRTREIAFVKSQTRFAARPHCDHSWRTTVLDIDARGQCLLSFATLVRSCGKGVIGAGCVACIPANSRVFYGWMKPRRCKVEIVDFDAHGLDPDSPTGSCFAAEALAQTHCAPAPRSVAVRKRRPFMSIFVISWRHQKDDTGPSILHEQPARQSQRDVGRR